MTGFKQTNRFHLLEVLTISIAHFVHDVYSSFLAPILPLLIEKLSISYSLAGILSVVQRAPSLLNPFVGLISDRLRVKYFLIFSPAFTATAMGLLGVAPEYSLIVLLLLITGISASMFHVPAPVFIRKVSGDKIGRGMGFFMLGGEIARSVAPMYVLAAVSYWGLEGIYKLIPLGWAASVIVFLRFRKLNLSEESHIKEKKLGANQTLKKFIPFFISIGTISISGALLRSSLTAFLPTYLTARGETLWMGGAALSTLQLSGALGTFWAGYISDRIGRANLLLIISIIAPVLMVVFTFTSGIYTIIILAVQGLFVFAYPPILMAEVNTIQTERPSFLNGIYQTLNFSAGGIAVLLVGILGDQTGLNFAYWLCAVSSFVSIPFILKLRTSDST